MSETQKKRVLIIGAGFGGLEAAKKLANKDVEVSLVDKHNHHLFQPLLYQVATSALTSSDIAVPIRHILRKSKNIAVYLNEICKIDTHNRIATAKSGREFKYDYLVLATGARHSYFGKDEWSDIAPGLKSIEDAREIKRRILTAFEKAESAETEKKQKEYLNFVIVGAGPTGVELAGAIAELAKHTLTEDFRHIKPESARIILLDGGARILPSFDPKLTQKAQKHLESLGVEVRLNALVKDIGINYVKFANETISSRTVIWAAGVQASAAGKWLGGETDRVGRIFVDEYLCAPDRPEIYVVGDTASYIPNGADEPLPGIAPVAKQMGQYVGLDILNCIDGKGRKIFKYKDFGAMATIGRNRAIADFHGFKVSGFVGWLLWGVAHVYFLVGFQNRLLVCLQWMISYMTLQRGVRLIVGGTQVLDVAETKPEDTGED